MSKKKLSVVLFSLIMLLALAGCSSSTTTNDDGTTTKSASISTSDIVQYSPGESLQLESDLGQVDIRIDSAIATSDRLDVEIEFVSHATSEVTLAQLVSSITAEQDGTTLSEATTTPIYDAVDDGMNETIDPEDDEEVEASFTVSNTTSPVTLTFTTSSGVTGSITLQPTN